MQGYADAYLDQSSPMAVDAMTVSPYLGFESLRPMLDTAAAHGAGVFVLGADVQPGGPAGAARAQRRRLGRPARSLDAVAQENAGARHRMGSVGAVVGANLTSCDDDLACQRAAAGPGFGRRAGPTTYAGSSPLPSRACSPHVPRGARRRPDATACARPRAVARRRRSGLGSPAAVARRARSVSAPVTDPCKAGTDATRCVAPIGAVPRG